MLPCHQTLTTSVPVESSTIQFPFMNVDEPGYKSLLPVQQVLEYERQSISFEMYLSNNLSNN